MGQVASRGPDAGLTLEEFRKKGKLKEGNRVSRDTTSNAMDRLRKQYQKKDRLEATVTLQKQTYNLPRKQLDYEFHVNQGPEVKVVVEGAKISKSRLHLLVPIYQEGTIDNDLLNEGVFNIRDYDAAAGVLRFQGRCEGGGGGYPCGKGGVHRGPRGEAQGRVGGAEGQ